jgi:hypothetical protein
MQSGPASSAVRTAVADAPQMLPAVQRSTLSAVTATHFLLGDAIAFAVVEKAVGTRRIHGMVGPGGHPSFIVVRQQRRRSAAVRPAGGAARHIAAGVVLRSPIRCGANLRGGVLVRAIPVGVAASVS